MNIKDCPCGSKVDYHVCCMPYIKKHKIAENPEILMRSRYVAFFFNETEYLQDTWHPETLPDELGSDEPSNWVGLELIEWDECEDEGEVEFKAKLIFDGKLEILHERSVFVREGGRWLYHSGEFLNDGKHVRKLKSNEECPCGSGKVFRNCHQKK